MTPLERAARALYQRLGTEIADPENGGEDERWPEFVDDARAVLQAIREPSNVQLGKGRRHIESHEPEGSSYQAAERTWKDMIDAALEEG